MNTTTKLQRKVRAAIRSFGIPEEARIVIGVSGGADSMALLDAIVRLEKFGIAAAHLNHCLRGDESDADEEFVMSESRKRNVEYISERVDIAAISARTGRNIEAAARDARYEFLTRSALRFEAPYVTTAHTRDDQVETVLLRLIRGASPSGLRGIHASRPLGRGITLSRPMLDVTRPEVLEHCDRFGIEFRTDSSNLSLKFTRNRVRHQLLPLLRELNPEFDQALVRTAGMIGEDSSVLDDQAGDLLNLKDRRSQALSLDMKQFAGLDVAIRRRMVRLWIEHARGELLRIEKSHLDAIDGMIAKRKGNKVVELPDGWRVELNKGLLRIFKLKVS